MALYMYVTLNGTTPPPMKKALTAKKYYRKQTIEHISHEESGKFTEDAKKDYARFNNTEVAFVKTSSYQSHQGVPNPSVGWKEI